MDLNENCVRCKTLIQDGDGRYILPDGVRCVSCGEKVNEFLTRAGNLLDLYS